MNNGIPTSTPPLETMIGQMIMVGFQGDSLDQITATLEQVQTGVIGGIILYDENITVTPPCSHNIHSPKQVAALTKALQKATTIPLLIAIDQEGGMVNRLKPERGFPPTPAWAEIGKHPDYETTGNYARTIARELRQLGINLNLAPVLDLARGDDCFMVKRKRCFSRDPELVSQHAEIFINVHREFQILTAGKHFPGQGSARGDTHEGLVDVTETWSEEELVPYQYLMDHSCLSCIMTSHLYHRKLDPVYPATLSRKIITDLLRNRMGFKGVIISDDPQMKALSNHYSLEEILTNMLHAGVDLFCFGNNLVYDPHVAYKVHNTILQLVQRGVIREERIQTSYQRILACKQELFRG